MANLELQFKVPERASLEEQLNVVFDFNYEELLEQAKEIAAKWSTAVYTEDSYQKAKSDRSRLNKAKKAFNDKRIEVGNWYNAPYIEFKSKIDNVIDVLDEPVRKIDKFIAECDKKELEEKMEGVQRDFEDLLAELKPPFEVTLDDFDQSKWKNKTCSQKQIGDQIKADLEKINEDWALIGSLGSDFEFEMQNHYRKNRDVSAAIAHGQLREKEAKEKAAMLAAAKAAGDLQNQKPAQTTIATPETEKETTVPDPPISAPSVPASKQYTVTFEVTGTKDALQSLALFLRDGGYKVKQIKNREDK